MLCWAFAFSPGCFVREKNRIRYDIGATSSVLTQLESSTYSDVSWYSIVADSTLLQGIITSNGVLGKRRTMAFLGGGRSSTEN